MPVVSPAAQNVVEQPCQNNVAFTSESPEAYVGVNRGSAELFVAVLVAVTVVQSRTPVLTHWETVLLHFRGVYLSILKIPLCAWLWPGIPRFCWSKSPLFLLSGHRHWCCGRKFNGGLPLLFHIMVHCYSSLSLPLGYKTLSSRICLFSSNFVLPSQCLKDVRLEVSTEDLTPKDRIWNIEM